jgi:coiled-coil domain-containing protein 63/114
LITDQFTNHWRKANRQLEIYEGRVQVSRQREGLLTAENHKLRSLIKDMLFDRAVFNYYWSKIVNDLKDRRKFLLDMIERSNQAFNQGADFLDNLKKLQSRRALDRDFHVSEMMNMERQIDANQIMNMFLGGKGKKRKMAPLEPREILRREMFKEEHSLRLNMYRGIIDNIKKFTGISDIKKAMNHYMRQDNDGFQFYTYLNEMNHMIEHLFNDYSKLAMEISSSQDYNDRKLKYFEERTENLHKQLHDEINKTMKKKDDREKFEGEIERHLDTITEIMKVLSCDLSSLQKLLGDHSKVTVFNIHEFFALIEYRLNEVLAFVYCDQRKNVNILDDDASMIVKSLAREQKEPVKTVAVITTEQCAECAEGEDVNRYDENTVYPLDHETIKANMREKVEAPQMAFRLHNLSKCNLPRSGVIAGRRYAE